MSRRQGRFSTHQNAGESLQRQLTAPAHKWRKAWVAPNGTQPESTYKVCRWVKVAKDDKDVEDEANEEGDDEEDEGEGEGEGEGEEEEVDEEGEGEGEAEDAEGEEGKTPAAEAETPAIADPSSSIVPTPTALAADTPAPANEAPTPVPEVTAPTTESIPALVPEPSHTAIPSNAIEMTNTAPNHVEDGNPTSTHVQEVGIEITKPPSQPPSPSGIVAAPTAIDSLGQNEDKMDVDEPDVEKGEVVQEDAGLVMGEMTPPVGEKELEVPTEDGDAVKETEAAEPAELAAGEGGV